MGVGNYNIITDRVIQLSSTNGWPWFNNNDAAYRQWYPSNGTAYNLPRPLGNVARIGTLAASGAAQLANLTYGGHSAAKATELGALVIGDRIRAYCQAAAYIPTAGDAVDAEFYYWDGSTPGAGPDNPGQPPRLKIPATINACNEDRYDTRPLIYAFTVSTAFTGTSHMLAFRGPYATQNRVVVEPNTIYLSVTRAGEIEPPGPPENLTVDYGSVEGTPNTVILSWEPPSIVDTANGSVIGGYNLYRDKASASGTAGHLDRGELIATLPPNARTYVDTAPVSRPMNSQQYRVCAIEAGGTPPTGLGAEPWEGCHAAIRVRIYPGPDDLEPPAPAAQQSGSPNTIAWSAVTDDTTTVQRYEISEYASLADWDTDTATRRRMTATDGVLIYAVGTPGIAAVKAIDWRTTENIAAPAPATPAGRRTGKLSNAVMLTASGTAPAQPANVRVGTLFPTHVELEWDAPDDPGIHFHVFRNGQPLTPAGDHTHTAHTYDDTTVVADTTYAYHVVAYRTAGEIAGLQSYPDLSVTTPADRPQIAPPTNAKTDAITATSIQFSWTAPVPTDPRIVGYHIYRAGQKIHADYIAALTYTDTGLNPNTQYTYLIHSALADGEESTGSAYVDSSTGPDHPPTAPTNLRAIANLGDAVELAWNAATDDVGLASAPYTIARDGAELATGRVGLTYTDDNVERSTTYVYTVTATDSAGQISAPATLSVTTPDEEIPPPTEPPPDTTLPWDRYSELAVGLAPHVASHAGFVAKDQRRTDAIQQATAHVPTVTTFIRGYTRGRGWSAATGEYPDGPLCAVIVSASARLLTNPEQLHSYSLGDYSEKSAVLAGWTLNEIDVLHRYRKISS